MFLQAGDPFLHYSVSQETQQKIRRWHTAFREFRDMLVAEVPEGRQRAMAMTALEDARKHALRALEIDSPFSEPREAPP